MPLRQLNLFGTVPERPPTHHVYVTGKAILRCARPIPGCGCIRRAQDGWLPATYCPAEAEHFAWLAGLS